MNRTWTFHPDDIPPFPPGEAERVRRQLRVRLPGPGRSSRRIQPTVDEALRFETSQACLRCEACGWTGGYADLEPHHCCPRCWRSTVDRAA